MNIQEACFSLKRLRLQSHLTQLELAMHSGVAYGTLRRLEVSGKGSLADYLRVHNTLQSRLSLQADDGSVAQAKTNRHRVRKSSAAKSAATNLPPDPAVSQQLSQKLGLDFPYDWSNPAMPEDTLIAKVLEKARFPDVSRIFARFGHGRVKQVAQAFSIDLNSGVLGALMPGIELGLSRHLSRHVSH